MSVESSDGRSPERYVDLYRAWYRTAEEIRSDGAIGSLTQGIEVEIHGVATRIIAWPGNGFQTQSIHVLTLSPGQETEMHTYGMAEEAMICLKGGGEAFVRGEWVPLNPGDLAFYPPNVPHAVRVAASATDDLVVVTAISPPEFDLYADAGFYNVEYGVINEEAAFFAHQNATPAVLSPVQEMRAWDTVPSVRPWNLTVEEIVSGGRCSTSSAARRSTSSTRRWCSSCGPAMGRARRDFTSRPERRD